MTRRARPAAVACVLAVCLAGPAPARAEWLEPDPTLRNAQLDLRQALRDTLGHGDDAARLDSLAVALLRLARFDEAAKLFRRALETRPVDATARAGLGKLALFRDRTTEAESLLTNLPPDDDLARADLYALRLRRGEYGAAAEMAADAGEPGREPLLRQLGEGGGYLVTQERDEVRVSMPRLWPAPLVRVRINGQEVLMALDTGLADLLLDDSAAKRCGVVAMPSESPAFWSGSRIAVRNALVQRLEIGGVRVERVPAGVYNLGRFGIEMNPQSEAVAGVIGANLLRRFAPTIDFGAQSLVLRKRGTPYSPTAPALRVPFELWGETELTVYGSFAGGRRMAMLLATGLPGCGAAAPREVFDELGIRPGMTASLAKSGAWLKGSSWLGVTVPTVSVGQMVRDRVPAWSGGMESGVMWRHGVRRDAVLAGEFLRGRRVTIDWQEMVLVVEASK